MLTNNSSNQKYNTIKQAINPATLLIGSIGLSRDISINSTFLNSQGQHLDSPNPTLSIPSNSSSSPPSKPQFNPVNHAQRVPQQVRDMTSSIRHHYVIITVFITMKYIVLTVEALTELEIKNAKIKAKNFIYKINRYQKKRWIEWCWGTA